MSWIQQTDTAAKIGIHVGTWFMFFAFGGLQNAPHRVMLWILAVGAVIGCGSQVLLAYREMQ